jgi:hypothetical protein
MTDTMTSQNIDLSSWDILYIPADIPETVQPTFSLYLCNKLTPTDATIVLFHPEY